MSFKRVHIFGGAGSGKTTLAREYSNRFGMPHHELDDFYYLDAATRQRREKSEREQLLTYSIASEAWVLDGIFWQPWIRPSISLADKIIDLAIPEKTRHIRVIKRHFQMLSKANINEYPSFIPTLFELLKQNRIYSKGPFLETLQLLTGLEEKLSVCTTNSEAATELGL